MDYSIIFNQCYYAHTNLFADFDKTLSNYNLIQMINFVTWSRMIGPNLRSSVLDHVYVKDPVTIRNLGFITPILINVPCIDNSRINTFETKLLS